MHLVDQEHGATDPERKLRMGRSIYPWYFSPASRPTSKTIFAIAAIVVFVGAVLCVAFGVLG